MKIGNNRNLVLGSFDESTPCLMIVLMNCQTKLRINHLTAVKSVAILESNANLNFYTWKKTLFTNCNGRGNLNTIEYNRKKHCRNLFKLNWRVKNCISHLIEVLDQGSETYGMRATRGTLYNSQCSSALIHKFVISHLIEVLEPGGVSYTSHLTVTECARLSTPHLTVTGCGRFSRFPTPTETFWNRYGDILKTETQRTDARSCSHQSAAPSRV
ncbi:alpha-2 adrenergic receptor [Trichonephila clavipes]|uniref:Alpha-2 adrenergic receptor n=1 Tax=Trichonephila clavipes TaxID=2585209 RepID=A0A8X6RHE1_TRICX|nr:alpha-2 adrenergic receptor [Trichonephila clavipes]